MRVPNWPSYTPTRFKYVGISRCGRSLIRFVCLDWEGGGTSKDSPSAIGPCFRTIQEAYAYLPEYAAANYPEPA